MTAVTVILLVVGLINRFIQYLGQAVSGEISSDVLFLLMFYRLPDFLLVILPLALFLAILLVYGRMYAENEMIVLIGSGMSQRKLLLVTQGSVILVTLLVAALSLQYAPRGISNTEELKNAQDALTELDLMVAGQFQEFSDGARVTYAERITVDGGGKRLENVFVVSGSQQNDENSGIRIVVAESARPEVDVATGARFMRLENVKQYEGLPGRADFTIGEFDVQAILLPDSEGIEAVDLVRALPTADLFGSSDVEYIAELQWRISAFLLIPILSLIAVPLSKVNPRQGRYSKLVPAALIYAMYFILLQFCRDALGNGQLSPLLGMWWVHLLFLGIGYWLYSANNLAHRMSVRKTR